MTRTAKLLARRGDDGVEKTEDGAESRGLRMQV